MKKKRNINKELKNLSREDLFFLTQTYLWEKKFLSKKGKLESKKGFG
jgi:hypothetical protein